jgi:hypothetical protein
MTHDDLRFGYRLQLSDLASRTTVAHAACRTCRVHRPLSTCGSVRSTAIMSWRSALGAFSVLWLARAPGLRGCLRTARGGCHQTRNCVVAERAIASVTSEGANASVLPVLRSATLSGESPVRSRLSRHFSRRLANQPAVRFSPGIADFLQAHLGRLYACVRACGSGSETASEPRSTAVVGGFCPVVSKE